MIIVAIDKEHVNPKQFVCNYTNNSIVIDGDLHEWRNTRSIILKDYSSGSDNVVEIKSLWDYENLYLAYIVKDKDLQARQTIVDHQELYLDDMIECLFDPFNEKDSCWNENNIIYHINLLGQKKDDRGTLTCVSDCSWNGNALYAVKLDGTINNSEDDDKGYVVEISITWNELGIIPHAGLKMGVNFACGDRNGVDNYFFDWVGANPFRSPFTFGEILLVK
jgi:hypothetical protein